MDEEEYAAYARDFGFDGHPNDYDIDDYDLNPDYPGYNGSFEEQGHWTDEIGDYMRGI